MHDMPLDQAFIEAERGEKHSANTVWFYHHPVLNPKLTAEKGQEIYEDKEYVGIVSPGQRLSEVRRKATDQDKQQFSRQYEAFLQKKAQPIVGTPLANLPGLTPARVRELEYLNIRTVQHLVDMPDSGLHRVGPDARQLQTQARAFLEKNDARVLTLEAQVKALTAKLDTLMSAPAQEQQPAKRRGRPPKNEVSTAHVAAVVDPKRLS